MSLADIHALLNVNVRSAVLASQAAIPHLKTEGRSAYRRQETFTPSLCGFTSIAGVGR